MIQGEEIKNLVNLLKERNVTLFHACQFVDFRSYGNLQGIPSRACLQESGYLFTNFETDEDDHVKDVWNKVFLNFSDFGTTFSNGKNGIPNPYGPILLKLSPEILNEAESVAVCIEPVGSNAYVNSELNSLKSINDINRIFAHPANHPENRKRAWVKYKSALREEFQCSKPCDPDISCTVAGGKLSLKYLKRVLIDPYVVAGKPLRNWVAKTFPPELDDLFQERTSARKLLYNELANLIIDGISDIGELSQSSYMSEELSKWAQAIECNNLGWQFRRFANYLRNGTLLEIHN